MSEFEELGRATVGGRTNRLGWLALGGLFLLWPQLANAQVRNDTPPAPTPPAPTPAPPDEIAELRRRIEELERGQEQRQASQEEADVAELRRAAEDMASGAETSEERRQQLAPDIVFTSGDRALQALNPEISVVVDTGLRLGMRDGDPSTILNTDDGGGSTFYFRHMGVHFETTLDPFSFTKMAIGFSPTGVGLGEAYITWVRVLPNVSLTLGKFRQQFGVINRWHIPSLDQFDQPLPLTEVLGPDGLNQIGLSFEWLLPTGGVSSSHELTLQVTAPSNAHLFSGEYLNVPTALLRLRDYFDLSDNTYLQFGLTGMYGMNNDGAEEVDPEVGPDLPDFEGHVWLGGADLTLSWSPLRRERYQHVTWRTEYYFVRREQRDGEIQTMGAYSYVDAGLNEALAVGLRGDVTQPFVIDPGDDLRYQVVGYLTWWQSPWVKLRLQGSHAAGAGQDMEDRLVLQFVFAAGPHKHERY